MPLDENVTQHQALTLLQQQREYVELVVARDKVSAVGSINTVMPETAQICTCNTYIFIDKSCLHIGHGDAASRDQMIY